MENLHFFCGLDGERNIEILELYAFHGASKDPIAALEGFPPTKIYIYFDLNWAS